MRSNLAFIIKRVKGALATLGRDPTKNKAGVVKLHWVELTGGEIEPLNQTLVGATATAKTLEVPALIHYVAPATTAVRLYQEMKIGDAILDLDPDTVIDGLQDLRFEFDGAFWMQKEIGQYLSESWDASVAGQRIVRSVLVRKAT